MKLTTPTTTRDWLPWLVWFGIAFDAILYSGLVPLLPQIGTVSGINDAQLGALMGSYSLAAVVVSIPFGLLSDRWRPLWVLFAGVAAMPLGTVVIALMPTPAGIAVGRLIQGTGSAATWTAGLVVVSVLAGSMNRGRVLGFSLGAASVGDMVGPAMSGYLADRFGMPAFFWVATGVGVVLALAVFLCTRDGTTDVAPPEHEQPSPPTYSSYRRLVLITAVTPIIPTVFAMLLVLLPLKLARELGMSAFAIGQAFLAWSIFLFVSEVGSGVATDLLSRRRTLLVGGVVFGVGLLVLSAGSTLWVVLAAMCVTSVGLGATSTPATAVFTRAWEAAPLPASVGLGMAYGTINAIWFLGFLIGNSGGGWLLTWVSMATIFQVSGLLFLVPSAMLLLSTIRTKRR